MRMNAPSSSFSFLADRKFLARARKVPVRGSAKVIGSRESERERERGGGGGGERENKRASEGGGARCENREKRALVLGCNGMRDAPARAN